MHMHVRVTLMRTTIELKDEYRAKLLELAARRGEKGFSSLVGEAIERYLSEETGREAARAGVRALRGALSSKETSQLRETTQKLRQSWR